MTLTPATRRVCRRALVAAFGLCLVFATVAHFYLCGGPSHTQPASTPASNAGYAASIVVKPLLKTRTDNAGHPLHYPPGTAEVTGLIVEIPPGHETGWHRHPMPCLAYVLEGEIHVYLKNGDKKITRAGEAAAEFVNLDHNGINPGPGPARLVFFVIGAAGQTFTVKAPAPAQARTPHL